jgi:hypothetical protein
MIIGHLDGFISTAGKIALQRGAKVIHCEGKPGVTMTEIVKSDRS